METRVWNGELFIQLRTGRFVPYLEWLQIRKRDPLEELRWQAYLTSRGLDRLREDVIDS